jgi:hypothetical protein
MDTHTHVVRNCFRRELRAHGALRGRQGSVTRLRGLLIMFVPALTLKAVPSRRERCRSDTLLVHFLPVLRDAGGDIPAVLGKQGSAILYVSNDCKYRRFLSCRNVEHGAGMLTLSCTTAPAELSQQISHRTPNTTQQHAATTIAPILLM